MLEITNKSSKTITLALRTIALLDKAASER